jgi:SpoVK/Ycf46/Vps4 family AAA+-type ATPase
LAIVLIDEADTFLSKRGEGANRSWLQVATTSVFLRHLEFFPGVIFLTTNQKAELDNAVISRVISLQYESLDDNKRVSIWKHHLAKDSKGAEKEEIESICNDLGHYMLDGRQIQILARITRAWCGHNMKPISKEAIKDLHDIIHPDKRDNN